MTDIATNNNTIAGRSGRSGYGYRAAALRSKSEKQSKETPKSYLPATEDHGTTRSTTANGHHPHINTADPMNNEREQLLALQIDPRTKEGTLSQLDHIVTLYQTALKKNAWQFARECQLTAVRCVRSGIKHEVSKIELDNIVSPLGLHLSFAHGRGMTSTIKRAINEGKHHPMAAFGKAFENVAVRVEEFFGFHPENFIKDRSGNVIYVSPPKTLSNGLTRKTIRINGQAAGEMIIVPASSPDSAGYAVERTDFNKAVSKKYQAFSSANYRTDATDIETGNWHPATLSIVNGKPFNLFIDPLMDGLAIIKDSRPQILNQKDMNEEQAIDFIKAALDNRKTVFQSNLLIYKGENLIVPGAPRPTLDERRVLATFQDGSYGIIQINMHLRIDELASFLSKIPGIENVMNLDTGGGNLGGYADASGQYQMFGTTADYEQATLFYIK